MKKLLNFILIFIFFCNNSVFANNNISIIRDSEIENFLREILKPILISANLNPNDINYYVVDDDSINAFVMGGQNIFVNTGTLISFNTPDAILGILAHEVGHISVGHLSRFGNDTMGIQKMTIASILLGVGAMLVGVPEVGQTLIFGGAQVGTQSILKYTRAQENVADKLAVDYLHKNHLSANALLLSMNKFLLNETGYSNETEYYMTHPLSKNRKIFLENQVKGEKKINDNDFNKKYKDKFNFMKAKIMAFQKGRVSNLNTDYTLYGEIIINMKNGKIDKSLKDINYLIEKYKNIPYFYELRGDIYFKTNKINESLKDYDKADEILKNDMLIKKTIAFSIIKYKQKNLYNDAITKLDFIIQNSNNDNGIYKLLAEVYYAKDELSLSYLNLSKYYFNLKDKQRAKKYILMAKENTNDIKILNKIEDFEIGMDNNF